MGAGQAVACASATVAHDPADGHGGARSPPAPPANEPHIVMATEEDDRIARLLGAQAQPKEFAATVLKAAILLKRLQAKHVASRPKYALKGSAPLTRTNSTLSTRDVKVAVPNENELQAGNKLLRQRLEFCGLKEAQISGDGNCQFRSLSYQLYGSQKHHAYVRARAVAHMRQNRADFEVFFEPGEFDDWVESMAGLRKWGDELTLRAAADAFQCIIHVIQSTPENWHLVYLPAGGTPVRRLVVTYVAPIHYNSIKRDFARDTPRSTPRDTPRETARSARASRASGEQQPAARGDPRGPTSERGMARSVAVTAPNHRRTD